MDLKDEILQLVYKSDDEENTASDLWSWLPSYKTAKICHDDYGLNFKPNIVHIMREASLYLALLTGHYKEGEQKNDLFECPCGECSGPTTCKNCDLYVDQFGRCRAIEDAPYCDEEKPHKQCPFIRGNGGLII